MNDDELRAWLATIKYQNDCILWLLASPRSRPRTPPGPPPGVVVTIHPGGETTIQPEGIKQ